MSCIAQVELHRQHLRRELPNHMIRVIQEQLFLRPCERRAQVAPSGVVDVRLVVFGAAVVVAARLCVEGGRWVVVL